MDPSRAYAEIVASLASSRVFSHIRQDRIEYIVSLSRIREFEQGSVLLQEGTANADVFFLVRGSVTVYSGGRQVAKYGRVGDSFGEMSVVSEEPVSETVIENEPVQTLVFVSAIVGSFKSANDSALVTLFYKLFSLSLLEKLRLTTLKARLVEDALRHLPLDQQIGVSPLDEAVVARKLNDTLLTSFAVHTAEHAILIADAEGRVVRMNLAAETLFECIEQQAAGQPLERLCDAQGYAAIYSRLSRGELSSWSGELGFVKRSGAAFPARASLSVIRDLDGVPIGTLSVVSDLTRQKQVEERLRTAEKLETLGRLASGIAHDLNNILTPIVGFTEIVLLRDSLDPEIRSELDMVLRAALRARDMVSQIRTVSRKAEVRREPVSVEPIVMETVRLLRETLPRGVSIQVDAAPRTAPVLADSTQLYQVLLNLCVNAGQAMPGGGRLRIALDNRRLAEFQDWFGSRFSGDYVCLAVQDSGIGINERDLRRIFEPFYTSGKAGGTGLGLSTVAAIVQQHGAAIQVSTRPGEGTTFEIYFPAAGPEAEALRPQAVPDTRGNECILFVDDEEPIRILVEKILRGGGYRVATAPTGSQALDLLKADARAFDLVITDRMMPEMNGEDLAAEARILRPDLPMLFCTALTDPISPERMRSMGVRQIIQKPISSKELLESVRRALS